MITCQPTTKEKIRISRFSIPFRIYGQQGPCLICLNGVQQSMAMWHSFAYHFKSDYRILLFDFPNQGKAEILTGPPKTSLDDQVDVLNGIVNQAEFQNGVTLCTASWGGIIALLYALRYPEHVKKLILSGIGTRPNKKMLETIKKGLSIDRKNRDEMAETLIESFGQNLPNHVKNRIIKQFRYMDEEKLEAFYEHGNFILLAENLTDVIDLSQIQTKTIILRGDHDTIIDSHDVDTLASKIPNCKIKVVKNVGHFLHLETEKIFDAYQEVLEDH